MGWDEIRMGEKKKNKGQKKENEKMWNFLI